MITRWVIREHKRTPGKGPMAQAEVMSQEELVQGPLTSDYRKELAIDPLMMLEDAADIDRVDRLG